uniref:DUF4789 domain-containing protein n=1 Tax=Phlebotomus papatasi TaxID=29031 RepID=A0A1B0CZN5_PHLPP
MRRLVDLVMILWILEPFQTAIVPPPWADPARNPCAARPGGWQLLFWPPLQQCFRIFQLGFPCPDTMELSPSPSGVGAECRCPPGTAQSPLTARCHRLFAQDPCDAGQFFAPRQDPPLKSMAKISRGRWGACRTPGDCSDGEIFWPADGKCYGKLTRGPCPRGKLLTAAKDNLAECHCQDSGHLAPFFHLADELCYEHFTRGPCPEGDLFLPSGECGCRRDLPQFHTESGQCFELGAPGPCPGGHVFQIEEGGSGGQCRCREGNVLWSEDGLCYRAFTRGPCEAGEFLMASNSTCVKNPCAKGELFFPADASCYRIGTQGPCTLHSVIVFDFTARPSIDGVSYNGVCGCAGIVTTLSQTCSEREPQASACRGTPGMAEVAGECHKLYTRGPCGPGEWLEPAKGANGRATCECKPEYQRFETANGVRGCHAPSVGIARYLNRRIQSKAEKIALRQKIPINSSI